MSTTGLRVTFLLQYLTFISENLKRLVLYTNFDEAARRLSWSEKIDVIALYMDSESSGEVKNLLSLVVYLLWTFPQILNALNLKN